MDKNITKIRREEKGVDRYIDHKIDRLMFKKYGKTFEEYIINIERVYEKVGYKKGYGEGFDDGVVMNKREVA